MRILDQVRSWYHYLGPSCRSFHKASRFPNHLTTFRSKWALLTSFLAASRYRTWDAWSLHPEACCWVANLVASGQIRQVIEFGAGFSTIFLDRFIRSLQLPVTVDSFEHQAGFNDRLQQFLKGSRTTTLHFCTLRQTSDEDFQKILTSPADAGALFAQRSTEVPAERYHETRLRNVFYEHDYSAIPTESIDLMILDGPNGNGRSFAAALLMRQMSNPAWILIDDYLDYPFLEDLRLVFDVDVVHDRRVHDNEFVIARISRKENADSPTE